MSITTARDPDVKHVGGPLVLIKLYRLISKLSLSTFPKWTISPPIKMNKAKHIREESFGHVGLESFWATTTIRPRPSKPWLMTAGWKPAMSLLSTLRQNQWASSIERRTSSSFSKENTSQPKRLKTPISREISSLSSTFTASRPKPLLSPLQSPTRKQLRPLLLPSKSKLPMRSCARILR